MSLQKPTKSKQKSLLSWVKPPDTEANEETENVIEEEFCTTAVPEKSSENSQDDAAVDFVEAGASHCQLPLVGDRPNQPRNFSFPSKSYSNSNRSFQTGWFDCH